MAGNLAAPQGGESRRPWWEALADLGEDSGSILARNAEEVGEGRLGYGRKCCVTSEMGQREALQKH